MDIIQRTIQMVWTDFGWLNTTPKIYGNLVVHITVFVFANLPIVLIRWSDKLNQILALLE